MSKSGYELFFGKQSPFSHHHACKFNLEDHDFHCMEQYMMYKKAEVFNDENIMQEVLKSRNPGDIKRLGRQVKDFDILKWMKVAVDIVKEGNSAKFWQNDDLYWALRATYPKQLVEASPSDTRWGIGLSKDNPDALDESKWRGRNLLGKLLTNLRDELMMGDEEIQERTLPLLESDQSAIEQELLVQNELEKSRYGSRERGQNWRSDRQNLQSDKFEFFWGSESPFSTYHEAEFKVNGIKFCCIEHVMLYGKADLFGDKKALETISKITRSRELRMRIDVNPYNPKTWTEHRTDIYKHAAREKFKQNPDLKKVLFATFPKTILRVDAVEQRRLESDPYRFKRDDRRHWSEFALMEVRDELLGKDSKVELGFNSSAGRRQSRKEQKRAGDNPRDEMNKQKKAKHRQISPDHYVNDVSNLFGEDLNLQSMESDDCSQNEAQNGPSSSKNTKPDGREKTKSDYGENKSSKSQKSETKMDWFDGTSTSETSHLKPNCLVSTGSGGTREKTEQRTSESDSTRWKRDKEHTRSGNHREKRNEKGPTGSEKNRGKESDGRQKGQGSKETKNKTSKRDGHEPYNSKERHLKTHGGTPKKSSRESSRDATSGGRDKSAENRPEETKPSKDYRKLKLSKDKKYTIIQNTNPISFEAECKFTVDGVVFNSVSHYTAYIKAEMFGDDFSKTKIKDATDAQVIKRLDGEVRDYNPTTWFAQHVEIHKKACKEKFLQNPELKQQLYDTYPNYIYKSGKSARGRVTDIDHAKLDKQDRSNKQDINNVLHVVRDELMKEEKLID